MHSKISQLQINILILGLGVVFAGLSGMFFSLPASAVSGSLASPFEIGSTWYVCQGYNGPVTHSGSDALALDFTKDLCDGSTTTNVSSNGTAVRAPLAGSVYWYSPSYGALCVNTLDNRSYMAVHMLSSLSIGANVLAGQQVGTVGAAGMLSNGGIAHLHLQMWNSMNCSGLNPIPFSSANNAQICGAPDMTIAGPNTYNNGTWSGTRILAQDCSSDSRLVYRFWSPKNQHHFYTASEHEALVIQTTYPRYVWTYEGPSFSVPTDTTCTTSTPVYRFWSNKNQSHFFTVSAQEKEIIETTYDINTWKYEGVAYCAYAGQSATTLPVYRFWSNKLQGHFYTTSSQEKDVIISAYDTNTWKYEGIAYYVLAS